VLEGRRLLSTTRNMHNPYKNPILARAFEGAVKAHAERNKSFFGPNGQETRNNWAGSAFWSGYHDELAPAQPGSQRYAVYRAGVAVARQERRKAASNARARVHKPRAVCN